MGQALTRVNGETVVFPAAFARAENGPDEGQEMFVEECRRAVMAAPRSGLDALAKEVWRAFGADVLSADEASELCEAIAAKRVIATPAAVTRRVGSRPRSSTSMERRRAWTASGWMPPAIAARFTMGEAAALGVVLAQIALTGHCELSHGAVGGRAGVSVSTVKRALGEARRLGLVAIEERRVSWCRNLPNVVTIVSAELRTWVATRGRGLRAAKGMGGGVQIGTASKSIILRSPTRPSLTTKAGQPMKWVASSAKGGRRCRSSTAS